MKLNLTKLARLPTNELAPAVRDLLGDQIVEQLLAHPNEYVRKLAEQMRDEWLLRKMGDRTRGLRLGRCRGDDALRWQSVRQSRSFES